MFQPNHREFSSSTTPRYLTIAPCRMRMTGRPCSEVFPAGLIVESPGFPATVLAPLNGEAVHAKHCSIRRSLKSPCVSLDELALIAASIGAERNLSPVAAVEFIRAWLADPKPIAEPR